MGFLGALKDAAQGLVGGGQNKNQKLSQAWLDLARKARDPEAQARYTNAAQLLFDGKENKAQSLFDQATWIEGAYQAPSKQPKVKAPQMNTYGVQDGLPDLSGLDGGGGSGNYYGGGGGGDNGAAYREAYQAALAQSQSTIEAQYGAALDEIAKREGLAYQAVDMLPAQYEAIYGPAQQATTDASNAIHQAQQASGLTPLLPAGAEAAPIQAALSGALANNQSGVPLLRLGVGGEIGKQRDNVNQQRASALTELAMQRAQYETSLQEMLLQRQWDAADQAASYAFEDAQASQQEQEDLPAWGLNEVNVDRGGQIAKFDVNRANAIRSGQDPKGFNAFAKVMEDLRKNPPVGKSGRVKQALVMARLKDYMRRWPHQAEAVSLALFDSGITGQIEA